MGGPWSAELGTLHCPIAVGGGRHQSPSNDACWTLFSTHFVADIFGAGQGQVTGFCQFLFIARDLSLTCAGNIRDKILALPIFYVQFASY